MRRLFPLAVLLLALSGLPAAANEALEAEVQAIEQLAVSAHWRESDARIEALAPRLGELAGEQRQRLEFVHLRNLGLAAKEQEALAGFSQLLEEDLAPSLRVRVYTTGISIAANVEDWPLAFSWLGEALSYLSQAPDEAGRLFGVASYLHTLVGEIPKARELAMQGLRHVEAQGNVRAICQAVADIALAEDHARNFAESETWRYRQIEECRRAEDVIFMANGKYGVGKMLAAQGRHSEALDWARQAIADFESAGFDAGAWSAKLVVAESLTALGRGFDEADAMLTGALAHYRRKGAEFAIAETEQLLASLAEARGDLVEALAHRKFAASALEAAESITRERQLAYLQVEFDTRLKEQQIALLEAERELDALQATATQRRQLLLGVGMFALLVTAILLALLLRHSFHERRRYRLQSERDGLTGLYNYQHVRRLGDAEYTRARAAGRPFTAIVADIDLFKQINDRHGHAAGDQALRSLGGWIREVVGERGIAARSGGDEFTVLLQGDEVEAEALVQRLRRRVEPITVFGQTFGFNLSAGICQQDAATTSLEQLIHKADLALYRAKHGGRDRVVCATADGGADQAREQAQGSLVVVGSGIQFGRHVSERALSEIREAEVVLCLVDPFALGMVLELRPDAVNLGVHYVPGRDRREVYRAIDAEIMAEVTAGKRVCAVFYGHPGVFADVPHAVLRKAREQGVPARMEPGISAEACLYADLGLDPGKRGVHSLEATQFLVYDRRPDSDALVLLWQVALAGDLDCTRLHAEPEGLQALVDKLLRWYPPDHEVILYEAAQLPIEAPRIERLALRDLPAAHYEEYTTLVIPALGELGRPPAD